MTDWEILPGPKAVLTVIINTIIHSILVVIKRYAVTGTSFRFDSY